MPRRNDDELECAIQTRAEALRQALSEAEQAARVAETGKARFYQPSCLSPTSTFPPLVHYGIQPGLCFMGIGRAGSVTALIFAA